jgi:cysteine desulfurase
MKPIYCDHNSTTPVDQRVAEAVSAASADAFANASSGHRLGQTARARLDQARREIATGIGAKPSEIVLTASGSEADNLAVIGALRAPDARGKHFVTVASEHHAITETAAWAEQNGFTVTLLPVDSLGRLDPDRFRAALRPDTQIASVMLANNEIGTILPIAELAQIAREHDVLFHTDAVQAIGKIPVDVDDLGVDLLSLSAHKFYGPKGIGALYVRQGVAIASILCGGGQEMGRRPGTENVPGAVGVAKAMELLRDDPEEPQRIGAMSAAFRQALTDSVDDIRFFGDLDNCLPNTVGVGFGGIDGEALMIALDLRGICVATGSACTTGARTASHVLRAMGVDDHFALGSIRFSFGRFSNPDDPSVVADAVTEEVARLRAMAPVQ